MRKRTRSKKTPLVKAAELAMAAPRVIVIRTARMLAAGAHPGPADRAEFSQMRLEKAQAFWESVFAIGVQSARLNQEYARRAMFQTLRAWSTPAWAAAWPVTAGTAPARVLFAGPTRRQRESAVRRLIDAGLSPVHKRATANASRLTRSNKR